MDTERRVTVVPFVFTPLAKLLNAGFVGGSGVLWASLLGIVIDLSNESRNVQVGANVVRALRGRMRAVNLRHLHADFSFCARSFPHA